jgi:hypothetical protein
MSIQLSGIFLRGSTETNAGRKRIVQTCVGTLSVSEQQAKKLQLKPRKRLSPWIEKSCLLLSANVSYENAARDFEELTGIAVGHSTQQRLVHRADWDAPRRIKRSVSIILIVKHLNY